MAFTAEELKAWVGTLGIPADKQAVVLESLGTPEVLTRVGSSVMAQNEFSRKMDELKTKETQAQQALADAIKAEQAKTQSYANDVTGWKKEKQTLLDDATAKREAAEQKLASVRDKIREVAPNYGIDDTVLNPIFDGVVAPPKREGELPRDFEGKFVPRAEFDSAVMQAAKIPAIMVGILQEHQKLFGSNSDLDSAKLIDDALASKLTIRQQWEKTYAVAAKRDEIAKAKHDADIKDAEERGAVRAKSEFLAENPGANSQVIRRDTHGSPVLDAARAATTAAKAAGTFVSAPESAAQAAARAWGEGKYKVA